MTGRKTKGNAFRSDAIHLHSPQRLISDLWVWLVAGQVEVGACLGVESTVPGGKVVVSLDSY